MLNSKNTVQEWVAKYPFLKIKDNSVYPWIPANEDEPTECWLIGDLPQGWINAFGDQMCGELLEVLGEYVDRWIIVQVKEKWGRMNVYYYFDVDDLSDEEIDKVNDVEKLVSDIMDKYDQMSYHTCAFCGAPATRKTTGWVLPVCQTCFDEEYNQ